MNVFMHPLTSIATCKTRNCSYRVRAQLRNRIPRLGLLHNRHDLGFTYAKPSFRSGYKILLIIAIIFRGIALFQYRNRAGGCG